MKKTSKKKNKKENFLKEVKKEMELVKWPTWKDVIKNTIATIVLIVIICAFFIALTAVLAVIKGEI